MLPNGPAALGPIRVLAANPHASSVKALSMLGIGRDALTTVASLPESEAMDMAALERQLAAGEGRPTLVLASAGTVNTVAFDDLPRLLALRERYPFWLHVDAAFGAWRPVRRCMHRDLQAGNRRTPSPSMRTNG